MLNLDGFKIRFPLGSESSSLSGGTITFSFTFQASPVAFDLRNTILCGYGLIL